MAIHGISGKPGGGKSYEAVKNHVIPAIKDRRKVVTNLPLNIDHFCDVYGEHVRELIEIVDGKFHDFGAERPFSQPDHFLKYDDWKNEKGQGVLFVVDECHLAMPSGRAKPVLLEYLSMHRHYGHDIILVTQNFKKVHRDIRDMVGLVYRAIKKSFIGRDDAYILKIHEGCTSQVVNTKERKYEPYVFKFYKSHTKSDSQVEEAHTQDITPWWRHKIILFSAIPFLGAIMLGSFASSKDSPQDEIEEQVESVKQQDLPVPQEQEKTNYKRQRKQNQNQQSEQLQPSSPSINQRQREYEEMVAASKKFHPFYKINLTISGFAEYTEAGRRVKTIYFSANQNGQHVFTMNTRDLMLAGYNVRILTECAVQITYYDYKDFVTCNSPRVALEATGQNVVSN